MDTVNAVTPELLDLARTLRRAAWRWARFDELVKSSGLERRECRRYLGQLADGGAVVERRGLFRWTDGESPDFYWHLAASARELGVPSLGQLGHPPRHCANGHRLKGEMRLQDATGRVGCYLCVDRTGPESEPTGQWLMLRAPDSPIRYAALDLDGEVLMIAPRREPRPSVLYADDPRPRKHRRRHGAVK